ncbi:MAG: GTPase HflX [Rhodobacteraceae bacterium]|nr:GTPase HflX [Paracoccaceae bacterium]
MSGTETAEPVTRAFVIHPELKTAQSRRDPAAVLEEALALADALPGLEVIGGDVVRLAKLSPGHLFGKGKVTELGTMFEEAEIDLVLVDGSVTPVQQRNLEKAWNVKLLDRTGLILEIFSDRARTREGVLQVEMAALSYQRTRLVRAWTHLERQRGGLGFVGGPGETQIEADRRAIDDHLGRLRKQLQKVTRTRELHRAARAKVPFPIVALAGYTNAGKSTLFNRLTGADVLVKDMLFATLDPTMRRVELSTGDEVIMSDTVGFISDLPTELVASFRATLEEVLDADLILHVRDISHPQSAEQAADVDGILEGLGVSDDIVQLEVWNKIDLLSKEDQEAVRLRAARSDTAVPISAITGEGLDELIDLISAHLRPRRFEERLNLPYAQAQKRAWLHNEGVITDESNDEDGFVLDVLWSERQKAQFAKL